MSRQWAKRVRRKQRRATKQSQDYTRGRVGTPTSGIDQYRKSALNVAPEVARHEDSDAPQPGL